MIGLIIRSLLFFIIGSLPVSTIAQNKINRTDTASSQKFKQTWVSKQDPCGIRENPNSIIDFDSVSARSEWKIEEFERLCFVSGMVYFTGAGFPKTIATSFSGKGGLPSIYNLNVKGTKIALEKCVFRNRNGTTTKPINKWITLQQKSE